jgi:error-prone DNA polymerase
VLALGMLSASAAAWTFIERAARRGFRMQDIPAEDPATYDMICAADTVGVFQIESRAQMSMLPRLKPRCFYDLVIEVAIVRPGPIQGGMVHPYLRRRQGWSRWTTRARPPARGARAHAGRADLPGAGDADRDAGRRLLAPARPTACAARWPPGSARAACTSSTSACRRHGERGYTAIRRGIFKQIEGFGEYGFPESHAASFALLVYVSCWLKRHEPAAFLAACSTASRWASTAPSQLVQDAARPSCCAKRPPTRPPWR